MDDENEDEKNLNSIELGVMSRPGCHSMPSTRCKNRDSESREQTGGHHHAADEWDGYELGFMNAVLKIEYIKDFIDIGLGFWRIFVREYFVVLWYENLIHHLSRYGCYSWFIRILRSNATATRCPIEKCSFWELYKFESNICQYTLVSLLSSKVTLDECPDSSWPLTRYLNMAHHHCPK